MAQASSPTQKKSNASFSKKIHRSIHRTRERALRTFKKTDKTKDDLFDEHVHRFHMQLAAANRLQKDIKSYAACAKAMSVASKNLQDTLQDMYEVDWTGHEDMIGLHEDLNLQWGDYLHHIQEHMIAPLHHYLTPFPETKERTSKRGRKLLDYDAARHAVNSLKSAKKPDEAKIVKAEEELHEARDIYESVNTQLHDDLPSLYDSRVDFLSTFLTHHCTAELEFLTQSAKLRERELEIVERLREEDARGEYTIRRSMNSRGPGNSSTAPPGLSSVSSESTPVSPTSPFRNGYSHSESEDDGGSSPPRRRRGSSSEAGEDPPSPAVAHAAAPTVTAAVASAENSDLDDVDMDQFEQSPQVAEVLAEVSAVSASVGERRRSESPACHSGEEMEEAHRSPTPPEADVYESVQVGAQLEEVPPAIPSTPPPVDSPMLSSAAISASPGEVKDDIKPLHNDVDVSSGRSSPAAAAEDEGKSLADDILRLAEQNMAAGNDASSLPKAPDPPPAPVLPVLPAGVRYQVQATHPYTGEDDDELTFEAGDVINIVEFSDAEDQDDGWEMGQLVGGEKKGVFPLNFTRKLGN